MNSDYDITLRTEEISSGKTARGSFLDSLGLSEGDLSTVAERGADEAISDEGVVLSSQPDGLDLPTATVVSSKGRALSFSVARGPERNRMPEISTAASEHAEFPEPSRGAPESVVKITPVAGKPVILATSISQVAAAAPGNLDAILTLECPECGGELVLKRRHIGIEGACVWCHAPIIAAESALDSQVRVVPILGRVIKPAACEVPLVSAPASVPVEGSTAGLTETHGPSEVKTAGDLSGDNTSDASGFDNSTPETVPAVPDDFSERRAAEPELREPVSPFDLDGLYAAHSFGKPLEDRVETKGFGETLTNAQTKLAEIPMTGFGAFLQEGSLPKTADISSSPSTWPITSAEPSPEIGATKQNTGAQGVSDTLTPHGFSTPTQWGPPLKMEAAVPESAADLSSATGPTRPSFGPRPALPAAGNLPANASAPSANEPIADNFTSAFGPSGFAPQIDVAPPSEKSTGFSAFLDADAHGKPAEAAKTPVEPEDDTEGFSFHNSPASKLLFGELPVDEKRTFAMPGTRFSTGSSSESDLAKQQPSLQQPGRSWGISEPIGTPANDDAPIAVERTMEMHTSFGEPSPSFFADSSFPSFSETPGLDPHAPLSTPSPFADPQCSEPNFSAAASPVETRIPNLTSQPLGEKPKVRKGFIVLMIIIIGFASGAALASFMLPVDEYVQTARAFMEQKFTPAAVSQQLPAVSPSPGIPVEPNKSAITP